MPIDTMPMKKDFLDLTKQTAFPNFEVRKATNDNYYLHNPAENWPCKYFIISRNTFYYTKVEVSFSEFNKKFLPKFKFSRHKIKDNSVQNLRSDVSEDKIALVDLNKDGSDNFWKLISMISKLKDVDLRNFQRHKIVEPEKVLEVSDQNIKTLVQQIINKNYSKEVLEEIVKQNVNLADDLGKAAIQKKREEVLKTFETMLNDKNLDEPKWQMFFENNPWIFGYGLNYIYCDNIIDKKLEQVVSGFDFNEKGKRVDALMTAMSKIQQFVLVEIKLPNNPLVGRNPRAECWSVSNQVVDGIAQIQKTEMKLKEKVFSKAEIKDKDGNFTGQIIYNYSPKSYLIIGNLSEFCNENGTVQNEDKYSSFQLFRKSNLNPEIITYDELYERAKFIVNQN